MIFRVPYALRATFIPSLRFGTGYASPYNPCHCLKLKNSKLNLLKFCSNYKNKNEIDNINGRTITFETDLSWESVARYTGYSVAAIAGACCYKWGFFPWVRYPG